MTTIETKLGLTPILKRFAYAQLIKGFGRHPLDHDVYDEVEVEELYPWQANPEATDEYGGGVKVTFFRKGRRIRWVEFNVRTVGGGGDPAIFRVK